MRFPHLPRRARTAALLLLAALAGCITIGPRPGEAPPLRVLVYNIHAGKDAAGARTLQQVAEVVRETGADLVLLQEVDSATERSGREDQLAELVRLTGLHGVFGRTLDFQGGGYGLAVLSRWPIVRDTLLPLPPRGAPGGPEPRGILHAVVAIERGDTLDVLDTHLDASSQDDYRLPQADTVRRAAERLETAGRIVLLGGDFNAVPESAVIARVEQSGWRDAWQGCGTGEGATIPAAAPTRRIDYLFLRAGFRCDSARVVDTQASDHRPVLFVLARRAAQ